MEIFSGYESNNQQDKKEMESGSSTEFKDLFPWMVAKLGTDGFLEELEKGFKLLMDEEKGLITFESLKRNYASVLGLDFDCDNKKVVIDDDEMIREMVREGDLDGDGCLNLMEFCVLMFRLSPSLMSASSHCLHHSFS